MAHRRLHPMFALALSLSSVTFAPFANAQFQPQYGEPRNHQPVVSLDQLPQFVLDRTANVFNNNDDDDSDDNDEDTEDTDDTGTPCSANNNSPDTVDAANESQGSTYGIFVGITRYLGENDDLPGSASDAQQLSQSFQRAGWMNAHNAIVLTDENATFDRVRQAFRTLAPRVRSNDTLVFFFDGHGNENELDLRGNDINRRELGQLLGRVAGRSLVVLDSCNAGGFASVVQGHPGRAGLFSSRASEESSTASEVNSGGWLAYNFRRAIDGGVARNSDGSLDFQRVTQYVQRGYRQHNVDDQHLVATLGDRRGSFSIGGGENNRVQPTGHVQTADVQDVGNQDTLEPLGRRGRIRLPRVDGGQQTRDRGGFPVDANTIGQMANLGMGIGMQVLNSLK
jgi:hypothetical protein